LTACSWQSAGWCQTLNAPFQAIPSTSTRV